MAMLLGFPQLVDTIERAREAARSRGASQLAKEVTRFTWRGEPFIEFSSPERQYDVTFSRKLMTAGASCVAPLRFALWEPEGGAVLHDGFALLPERHERSARSHTATNPISPILASEDTRPPFVRQQLSTSEQIKQRRSLGYELPALKKQSV